MSAFWNIYLKVQAHGDKLGLTLDDYAGLMQWAAEHEPELRAEERKLFDATERAGEKDLKKAALAWGKTLIKLFEAFARWKEKKAAAAPVSPPEPPKRYEPRQARLGL